MDSTLGKVTGRSCAESSWGALGGMGVQPCSQLLLPACLLIFELQAASCFFARELFVFELTALCTEIISNSLEGGPGTSVRPAEQLGLFAFLIKNTLKLKKILSN